MWRESGFALDADPHLDVSERRACRALGQHRSTQRKVPRGRDDEAALTADLVELARRYGRYGYRKIGALLKAAGWLVNGKRVERIWLRGLKVPTRRPNKVRLCNGDGSCIRLRPERRDHVWAYDFVEARTHDGRKFRMLDVDDEFTRKCLAIRVARSSARRQSMHPCISATGKADRLQCGAEANVTSRLTLILRQAKFVVASLHAFNVSLSPLISV
ncbi:hypothetical protein GOFOIKOB_6486 [Methylobacterium tardum]|uniref:HTH-like domain-containing protein n=1 Tax=Methylobacterium tardum TaxID=374432 RepID=A0AA37T6U6_9HYPH|nr:hypothetical protein GOFOIKOB_6486 [Methylobacterium tardum]GLS68099.1 hypothetical protein GCM10007890_01100 [Methylobacterium tardum]